MRFLFAQQRGQVLIAGVFVGAGSCLCRSTAWHAHDDAAKVAGRSVSLTRASVWVAVLLTDQADLFGPSSNGTTRVESSAGSARIDPDFFASTGAMGGHMIPVMSEDT